MHGEYCLVENRHYQVENGYVENVGDKVVIHVKEDVQVLPSLLLMERK